MAEGHCLSGKAAVFLPKATNEGDVTMDWIERLLGISPDGGDGSTELLFLLAAAVVVTMIFGRSFFVRLARKLRN